MTDHYYEQPDACCDDDQCRCIERAIEDLEDRAQEWAENQADIRRFGP